jgi:hypothetical protein
MTVIYGRLPVFPDMCVQSVATPTRARPGLLDNIYLIPAGIASGQYAFIAARANC